MLRKPTSLAAAIALAACASTAGAEELLRRARSLEERVGRIELRRTFGPRLQVVVQCDSDPSGCVEERIYAEAARLDFLHGVRAVDGERFIDEEHPVGTIHFAVDFSDSDRQLLWSEIRKLLVRLSANAFVEPLAGWRPMRPPFDKQTLSADAELPTWACFESAAGTTVLRVQSNGSAHRYEKPPTPACAEMRAATDDAPADVVQTLASPRRLLELVVEHEDVMRIEENDPDSVADLPDGVRLIKARASTSATVESVSDVTDGGMARATHMANGWRFDALTGPAEMPIDALDRNGWLHDFTVTYVERELGPDPVEQVVREESLLVAYLATVPPTAADHDAMSATSKRVRIDRPGLLRALGAELDRQGGSPLRRIEAMASRPQVGLRSEGWLIVVCREDGSATYYLPPTQAFHRVTNAALFCGALEARLR